MPIAAVPIYLGTDFSQASPGMRFGMYLKLWGVNQRSANLLWQTFDVDYKVAGQNHQEREVKIENKFTALKDATRLTENDVKTMRALLARQAQTFVTVADEKATFCLDTLTVSPFTTGLGNEHPLENGFSFLTPYGLPYLPGSGVKGVLRQAARELCGEQWSEKQEWNNAAITALFGRESENGDSDSLRGALTFWDVIPQIAPEEARNPNNISLTVEIMTPHQSHYYQNNQSPHESGQPSPNNFLTVPPKSRFVFHVQCNLAHLNRTAPELIENGQWKNLLDSAFRHAFDWLGFGAKTAVGYGAMQENPAAQKAREEKAAAVRAEAQRLADAAHRESMSSEDKAWADNEPVITTFRAQFETAKKTAYKPGCQFDGQRVAFMNLVENWVDPKSRQEAGAALKETANKGWGMPSNKDSKKRIQDLVAALCPSQP